MKSIGTTVRKLTFDGLRGWAGEKILNRGKYPNRRAHNGEDRV